MDKNLLNSINGNSTLVELLRERADKRSDLRAYTFLADGEAESGHFTFMELDRQARAIAALLQQRTRKGDRVLLLYPPGLEFVAAFFGSLYAGVMAVPAYPPRPNRPMPRLQSIIEDSEATAVLTVDSVFRSMERRFEHTPMLKKMFWVVTDRIEGNPEILWNDPGVNSETIAFLQYTSGSTAAPKGVMVSHGNLLHNEQLIKKAYGHSEKTVYVSWLPLFHDMGLIGNVLQTAYLGTECILMAPAAFLQKPYRWLKAVSDYKAHTSGGPNFAYDLCNRLITPEQIQTLDLSSWRMAFNGAEPVRYSTIERFIEIFSACGFKREAFQPCYGLAEATLFVTGGITGEGPSAVRVDSEALKKNKVVEAVGEGTQFIVSCGKLWSDQEVVIADPETMTECAAGNVGEVWITGPSVAKGYWNRIEETEYTLKAYLKDTGRGPFLRTGDMGFVKDRQLFITGRIKDLIIVRGRNHYPQDIELTVEECHEALRAGCGAAFSVDAGGEERLVIVQEVERTYRNKNLDDVIGAIRNAVAKEHELQCHAVVLIMPGSVTKTSSGKIQRRACKSDFLEGNLEVVAQWKEGVVTEDTIGETAFVYEGENMEDWLLKLLSVKLGVKADAIDKNKPISHYGMDSLKAVELAHTVETNTGVSLPISSFFEELSISGLVGLIESKKNKAQGYVAEELVPLAEDSAEQPLSRGQRALWFLCRLDPKSTAYNISRAVKIKSALDIEAFRRVVLRIADRHPALRTTFSTRDGEPVQIIHKNAEDFLLYEDASAWNEELLDRRLLYEANRPFDLEKDRLFRLYIFSRSQEEHILLFSVHHIITDFWSMSIFMNELGSLYKEELEGVKTGIPELELKYSDYVYWQERMLEGPEGERLLSYWKEQLSGELPVLNIPTDRPRPAVQSYRGSSLPFKIDAGAVKGLKELAAKEGVTLFMLLLAVFQTLLHRYTGQEQILVGSPTAGRDRAKLADIMGYFVNPVVLKSCFNEGLTFSELLNQVRRTVLSAYEHQGYPFASLVEKIQAERDPGRSPVFQAMFVLQKSHLLEEAGLTSFALGEAGAKMNLGGLVLESMALEQGTSQFDLTLNVAESGDFLSASLEYNTDLFDKGTIERLSGYFTNIVNQIIENPIQDVSRIRLLSEEELKKLTIDWNNTYADYPGEYCLHDLFELQAERTPLAQAVVCEDESMTYGELASRSNRLANTLRSMGVGPDILVGICMERSIDMMVGLLGILKAGGAYVPLDPAFPKERLSFMAEDSGITVLLTKERLADAVPGYNGRVLCLDREWDKVFEHSDKRPDSGVGPENLAYVIFTSGSTGKPKGVQIPHRAVVNFMNSMRKEPGLTHNDILLSVTTLSFDIAALELFLPLVCGARTVLVSREVAYDGVRLIKSMDKYGVTVMQATPATWRLLIEADWKGSRQLKILCGGEALPSELAGQLVKRGAELWNMYGPTETTIWSAVSRIEQGDDPVSIGRPIDNTLIYILDANLQPVPEGTAGELYIGGAGLSSGYLKRPELTEEKFIPNPFHCPFKITNSHLIYRTGDMARYLPDGKIQVLGRMDHQVKIRGFRIELGEIEAAISRHPAVREVVVMAREVSGGDNRLAAYIVFENTEKPLNAELREFIKDKLPDYMVPSAFVAMEAFPLTPNGKIDRRRLPMPEGMEDKTKTSGKAPKSELERTIARIWQEVLHIEKVGVEDNFFDLGGHSVLLARVNNKIKEVLNMDIPLVDLYKYPTVGSLAVYLSKEGTEEGAAYKGRRKKFSARESGGAEIAVIGMAGRFPGARNVDEFWQNLKEGVESVTFFTDEELAEAGVDTVVSGDPNYVKARAILEGAENFDAAFFGYSPREAEVLDPQHRVFLECAWEALENAGYISERYDGRIGVFAGVGLNHYLLNMYPDRDYIGSVGGYQAFIGNDKDFVPTRVSYKLNLKGPSINVQTACSSSLVALHLASRSLIDGECDIALAGGVSIRTPQKEGYLYQEGGIPSPDGHCRAFDEKAKGTVFGNGAGILVVKRLDEAMADGDSIYAVIKGSAINNDGASKVGYTAPGVEGQAEVIWQALDAAGVEPEEIGYIEAHGTGTHMGDPIEMAALKEVYNNVKDKEHCAIGSVKSNIGHLDTAAGAAGLIKTVLSLKHGMIPPSINFESPNPKLGIEDSPFYINDRLTEWKEGCRPRLAGVSSFGIGGTNAHVIAEEPPLIEQSGSSRPWQLFLMSAKTPSALDTMTQNLADFLKDKPDIDVADTAYTLQVGRRTMNHRRIAVFSGREDAITILETSGHPRVYTGYEEPEERSVAFMFSGQGSQYIDMALDLYKHEPFFKEQVDKCCKLLEPHIGFDLRRFIYPGEGEKEEAAERLMQTSITQPALFVIEYSLACLWMAWGVNPRAMIGHSIGEYAAACIAGVFELEDALALVAERGRLMQSLPGGAMLVVQLDEKRILPYLKGQASIAAINSTSLLVVSGTYEEIESIEKALESDGIIGRRLHTSHAFHSRMMEPILDSFAKRVGRVKLNSPKIPFISNVSGTWITDNEATDPGYWVRHLRNTVRFCEGIEKLLEQPDRVLLEVGPGQSLCTMVKQQLGRDGSQIALSSVRHIKDSQPDTAFLITTLGKLWIAGVQIDWKAFYLNEKRRRIPLPTYPFEKQRYMFEARKPIEHKKKFSGKNRDISDWFYIPSWKKTMPSAYVKKAENSCWLVFSDACGFGERLGRRLEEEEQCVIAVLPGNRYEKLNDKTYLINPSDSSDYELLLKELKSEGRIPENIVHLWTLTNEPIGKPDYGEAMEKGFYSLIYLARAAAGMDAGRKIRLGVVTNNMEKVESSDSVNPVKALLLGPYRVIPQEYPDIECRCIDIRLETREPLFSDSLEMISAELSAGTEDRLVAYRGTDRWAQIYEKTVIGKGPEEAVFRKGGVYLVSGGLGGIGLEIAGHIAKTQGVKLILTTRSPFPMKENWEQWLLEHDRQDYTSVRIKKIQGIEEWGAEVIVAVADVTDETRMREVLAEIVAKYGTVNGVIHAAGLPGGGIIQLKAPAAAESVLAPKVKGTLALQAALEGINPDFVMLCSSINAVTGGFGQVDYTSANAFMDAFAQCNSSTRGTRYLSVNWDRWIETGMAVKTLEGPNFAYGNAAMKHPLLDKCLIETPEQDIYMTEFSVERHWVLSEHLVAGMPTLPGTTYLEMARAAFEKRSQGRPVDIREVVFMVPMVVRQGEKREALTVIKKDGDGYSFSIASRLQGVQDKDSGWYEHAAGKISVSENPVTGSFDMDTLTSECAGRKITVDSVHMRDKEEFVGTGPRWQNFKKVYVREDKALAVLELPDGFAADLEDMKIHPALMDVATGSVQRYAGKGNYLPLAYERLTVKGSMTPNLYGYVRIKGGSSTDTEVITCDISILDKDGKEIVEAAGFSMKRVNEDAAEGLKELADHSVPEDTGRYKGALAEAGAISGTGHAMNGSYGKLLGKAGWSKDNGILTAEGLEAFERILTGCTVPRIIVSTRDLQAVIEESNAMTGAKIMEEFGKMEEHKPTHARPAVKNTYTAPENELEEVIAGIWQKVLGIEQVGTNDNFFDLGGTSLTGIQVVSELKKELGKEIPAVSIFEAPTVSLLAKLLNPNKETKFFEHVQNRAEKRKEALGRQIRQTKGRR